MRSTDPLVLLLIPAVLLWASPPRAADPEVDLESVRRIVTHGASAEPEPPLQIAKLLDSGAFRETQRLGQGRTDWTPQHPGWKAVYDRVRSDLERERAPITSAAEAERARVEGKFLVKIASSLSAADAHTILAYYDSAEGQRYQTFMQRIDRVMAEGMMSVFQPSSPPPDRGALESAESQRYYEMLLMSDPIQTVTAMPEAQKDPSGLPALGMMAAGAVASQPAEVKAILAEYSADLTAFASFQKTQAAQGLFKAMGLATQERVTQTIKAPLPDMFDSARRKYAEQWQAEYRAHSWLINRP